MDPSSDNRAVSALFRVFGGPEEAMAGDTGVRAEAGAMNLREFRVLSLLVPPTAWVAMAHWIGGAWAWILAVPAGFLAINLLPVLAWRKTPAAQWRVTLGICLAWAAWHCRSGGVAGVLSWMWIGIAILNTVAAVGLAWRKAMEWHGTSGIVWRWSLPVVFHGLALAAGWKWGWQWTFVMGAGIAAVWALAVFRPGCQWLGPVTRTTDDDRPLITIDDGPDPVDTPVLLDLLDRHQAKAIFFMIGEKVRAHPELAREVVRRGHEIGNHTLTHPQGRFWGLGSGRTRREIAGCQEIIEEITGIRPRWFRAPVGHRNFYTHPIAADLELRVMAWNRRGYDAVSNDAAAVLAKILPNLSAGDIVLVHEATPIAAEVLAGVLEFSHPLAPGA